MHPLPFFQARTLIQELWRCSFNIRTLILIKPHIWNFHSWYDNHFEITICCCEWYICASRSWSSSLLFCTKPPLLLPCKRCREQGPSLQGFHITYSHLRCNHTYLPCLNPHACGAVHTLCCFDTVLFLKCNTLNQAHARVLIILWFSRVVTGKVWHSPVLRSRCCVWARPVRRLFSCTTELDCCCWHMFVDLNLKRIKRCLLYLCDILIKRKALLPGKAWVNVSVNIKVDVRILNLLHRV